MLDPNLLAEIEAYLVSRERQTVDNVFRKLKEDVLDYQMFKLAEIEQRIVRLEQVGAR